MKSNPPAEAETADKVQHTNQHPTDVREEPAKDADIEVPAKVTQNDVLALIFNPASGSARAAADDNGIPGFREQIEKALQAQNANYEFYETTKERGADAIAQQLAKEGAQHIVVCGGDGTVMGAVNGLFRGQEKTDVPNPILSIVPAGTANLLATALGISTEVEKAVKTAIEGRDTEIDLGRCGESVFALGLGLGLTERLVSQASARDKEKLGKWAYAKAMYNELGAPPTKFRFKIDNGAEQTDSGVAVVVANAGDMGGKLQFAPDARMDDGLLDLCILHRFSIKDAARMLVKMLIGKLPSDRAVTFLQAKEIEILSEPPLDLQIDGEEVDGGTPLTASVMPNALRVRVPQEQIDEETDEIIPAAEISSPRPLVLAALGVLAVVAGLVWWRRRD